MFYAGLQLKLAKDIHSDNNAWNRRYAAQQALGVYNDVPLKKRVDSKLGFIDKRKAIPLDAILDKIEHGSEEDRADFKVDIHRLLNLYESLARGVNHGVYDKKIISAAKRSVIMRVALAFDEYIIYRQRKMRTDAWSELKTLAESLAKDPHVDDRAQEGLHKQANPNPQRAKK